MYSHERIVRFSQLDVHSTVGYADMLRYFQDVAVAHTEACDYGLARLTAEKCAWILLSMRLVIKRPPGISDVLTVSTWTTDFARAFGNRSFRAATKDGEELALGASMWAFLDIETGRPRKIIPEIMERYGTEPPGAAEYIRHEPTVENAEKVLSFPVLGRDIDTNGHMNNVKYTEYAGEALGAGEIPREMEIYYKHPAYIGDILTLSAHRTDNAVETVIRNAQELPCAYVKFIF